MAEFDRFILEHKDHDSKSKLAVIFIVVSITFCFVYTVIFALMGNMIPAWLQLTAIVPFISAYYLVSKKRLVLGKVLAIIASYCVTMAQSVLFFGSAYGFHFMLIGHIVVTVMIFDYTRKHAGLLLGSYLCVVLVSFVYAEGLETGLLVNLVNPYYSEWFFNTSTVGTIMGLVVIMYYFSKEIDLAKQRLLLMSITDEMTNLYNRRIFMEYGNRLFLGNDQSDFSVFMIDVDFFKTVNDTYGHDCGDCALINMSNLFQNQMRSYDMVARYGGEEFAVLLPRTDAALAEQIANRLVEVVGSTPILIDEDRAVNLTVSIGVSNRGINTKDFSQMISKADEALYIAKNKNRNCVYVMK